MMAEYHRIFSLRDAGRQVSADPAGLPFAGIRVKIPASTLSQSPIGNIDMLE